MFEERLIKEAGDLGIALSPQKAPAFETYMRMLLEWNKKMNLTAITEPAQIITKHFADSLSLLRWLNKPLKVIDVGTGAGFPGLPLIIAAPYLDLTLMDSVGKRFIFIQEVLNALGIRDVKCVHSRAEDAGRSPHRARYDAAVSRAVAHLAMLSEYCIPLLKCGGAFYAMKGPDVETEMSEAGEMIARLGGRIRTAEKVVLSGDICHTVVIIDKIKETPGQYPRRPDQIKKTNGNYRT